LKKEATERTSRDTSEISEGADDTESITSEIFGAPEAALTASTEERRRKRSMMLGRLDEDSELGAGLVDSSRSGIKSRPLARRSISRELLDMDRESSSRPVARRSISRELFDVQFVPPATASGGRRREELEALRTSMHQRERSLSRELEALSSIDPLSPFSYKPGGSSRSVSLSRQSSLPLGPSTSSAYSSQPPLPSRPLLSTQGRSFTQNDFFNRGSRYTPSSSTSTLRSHENEDLFGGAMLGGGRYSAASAFAAAPSAASNGSLLGNSRPRLDERGRSDWRRISVPERGKDFKSLPRKYNR
jgi:hypothetical protein